MIERTIYPQILKSIQTRPITLIAGARQVGKSTLCAKLAKEKNYNYVSLDDIRERETAIKDPELFLRIHKWPLIIDEVQYAPALFDAIEHIVNEERMSKGSNRGMYVLTGSQSYALLANAAQSMAGRVGIISMSPLSASEINAVEETPFDFDALKRSERVKSYKIGVADLYRLIVRGMYPELYDDPDLDSDVFYSDYVESYINKDVSQIVNLKDKIKFQNFMEILASSTGEELVYDTIAKAIGVSCKTIESWISVLVAGDIIHLLQPYNENSVLKRVVKRPKVYFCDTGLACFLSRLNNPGTLRLSRFNGRFVETYIVNEIIKSFKNSNKTPNFFYYRDKDQREIDLIVLDGGKLNLIECKSGVSYGLKDVSAFGALTRKTRYEIGARCIVCNTETIYSIGDGVIVFPISAI